MDGVLQGTFPADKETHAAKRNLPISLFDDKFRGEEPGVRREVAAAVAIGAPGLGAGSAELCDRPRPARRDQRSVCAALAAAGHAFLHLRGEPGLIMDWERLAKGETASREERRSEESTKML